VHETPSSGSRVISCVRTDRYDEVLQSFIANLRTGVKTNDRAANHKTA